MRIFIIVLIATASMASAQTERVTDKASCLSQLRRAISMAELSSNGDAPSVLTHQDELMSEVPDREKADRVIQAYREIGTQYQIIADTLMEICATY